MAWVLEPYQQRLAPAQVPLRMIYTCTRGIKARKRFVSLKSYPGGTVYNVLNYCMNLKLLYA